jgi:hypothetical protein
MRGTWQTTDSGGGGGLVLAVVVVLVLIGSGAASAVVSAVAVIAITVAVLAVAVVLGGIALLVYRTRSERAQAASRAAPRVAVPPGTRLQLEESHKPATPELRNGIAHLQAIEPPREVHYHFHVDPDQMAAIINRIGREE